MKDEMLLIDNQLCFPLYALSRSITRRYRQFLEPLGLTYTQYITMMVLWEKDGLSVNEIGRKLRLDSGTLTPLLKSMEASGLLERRRSLKDERTVMISLTRKGKDLRSKALEVPGRMAACMKLPAEELKELKGKVENLLAMIDE
ncbi:MAG TPA: MarR family transcriptional regulator [Bacillota bacterium]|nr:MarR family transcriptional regulator [Bacillota bacterium]HOA15237.1 MarR family transcriptional regulator [Bacillota bacterium]HOG52304.1 MarR family transcriptional regulator [Bacillota bacterium]